MQVTFSIKKEGHTFHFHAEQVYQGQSIEKFEVTLVGTGTILIQSNRPYLLHHKLDVPITWKQLQGRVGKVFFDVLCIELAIHLKKELPVIQSPVLTLF